MPSMSSSNSMTVKLHRALYVEDAISEAAATFADFASFAVRSDGDYYVVDVTNIDSNVAGDVVAEFCNFALANTAIRGKSTDA
jgi:hypothetical protein